MDFCELFTIQFQKIGVLWNDVFYKMAMVIKESSSVFTTISQNLKKLFLVDRILPVNNLMQQVKLLIRDEILTTPQLTMPVVKIWSQT